MIKKDRHKAANAALIASKKANIQKQEAQEDYDKEEQEVTNAKLEDLRAAMEKMQMDAEETGRLNEQIFRQERTISTLKSAKGSGGGTVPVSKNSKSRSVMIPANRNSKSPSGDGPYQALGDCLTKQNAQQQSQKKMHYRESRTRVRVCPISSNIK